MFEVSMRGRVAVVTLSRPPVNAISREWGQALDKVLDDLEARDDWSVLQLRSNQKVFAAGADLAQIHSWFSAPRPDTQMTDYLAHLQAVFNRLESLSRITLAEIGGAALGGGMELALSCDLRVVANEAKMGLPEVGIGFIPGIGGTQRMTRLVGRGTAARLILSAEPVDGQTALALGLAQWSVPRADIAAEAARIADRLAAHPLPALKAAKELIAAQGANQDAGYSLERQYAGALMYSTEARGLISSFLQKSAKPAA